MTSRHPASDSQSVSPIFPTVSTECGNQTGVEAEAANNGDGGVLREIQYDEEDIQPRTSVPTPAMPTQSDIDEHRIDHIPYRSWCSDCVEGHGREWKHTSSGNVKRTVPLIPCDYLFNLAKNVYTHDELYVESGDEHLKVLVAYDSATRALFAHAVPKKGVDEFGYIVDQLTKDVVWLGHSKVMIKSDNEPAILQLVYEALKVLKISGMDAASEGSVPYDPQTNGAAESAVRTLKGSFRTLQVCLERQLGAHIPVSHPLMTWLVKHSAFVRTARVRGEDGRTAFQRARGTESNSKLIGFGEHCRFKARSQEKQANGLQWRWYTRVWL